MSRPSVARWTSSLGLIAMIGLVFMIDREAIADPRPNILIVVADDMSWTHTSISGAKGVNTPAFDSVARAGVLMKNAFSGAPGCSPSRASLLTGRQIWMLEEAGVLRGAFPAKFATFPDLLAAAGYSVGWTGKGWAPGDWKAGGRKSAPTGPAYNQRLLTPPTPDMGNKDYTANFADFLAARKSGTPFLFWYGADEPHRNYAPGSGIAAGKNPADVVVPGFLPDTPEVRSDFLDYFLEIEWFDRHLGNMLEMLRKSGELENTLVIVTADNGMPMLRAKATAYEYGLHVPLAISWPTRIPGDRKIDDPVSFVDLTATILSAAGVAHPAAADPELAPVGRDMMPMLTSSAQGRVDPSWWYAYAGHERHTLNRYDDVGYPIRVIRTPWHLYIRNLRPERWPVGDPQRYDRTTGVLFPPYAWVFRDIDDWKTRNWLIARRHQAPYDVMIQRILGKQPAEELYEIWKDPDCLVNVAALPDRAQVRANLARRLDNYLKETNDPRLYGPNPDIADTYFYYDPNWPMGLDLYPPSPDVLPP